MTRPPNQDSITATPVGTRISFFNADIFAALLILALQSYDAAAQVQERGQVPRVGYLTGASVSSQLANRKAFQKGLHELGYV